MLKMQFIQKIALINVRRLIRIGLLVKTMFLCKNMPCASTTQLTKARWSALKIWRHFIGFLINVETSIFSSPGWTFRRLRAQRWEGCYSALHSHPHSTFINQSPRADSRPRLCPSWLFSCPTLLPAGTSPWPHSVTWCCLGECCMEQHIVSTGISMQVK